VAGTAGRVQQLCDHSMAPKPGYNAPAQHLREGVPAMGHILCSLTLAGSRCSGFASACTSPGLSARSWLRPRPRCPSPSNPSCPARTSPPPWRACLSTRMAPWVPEIPRRPQRLHRRPREDTPSRPLGPPGAGRATGQRASPGAIRLKLSINSRRIVNGFVWLAQALPQYWCGRLSFS
jgi:hypothetical protein